MKKGLTEMVFVLDRSGSMAGLEKDTIGGFNSLIEKQKNVGGEAVVSTVLFDGYTKVLHDRVDINQITPMDETQYCVGGCTALLDALGGAIHHIVNVHRYIRKEDVPEHTVFVVTTDGMENASRLYSATEVRGMVEREQRDFGWEFLFLGANMDAIKTAEGYGIPSYMAANYEASSRGTVDLYDAVCNRITITRKNARTKSRDWAQRLDANTPETPETPDKK